MFNNLGTEGTYLNMIQVMYGKPTGDILKGERLKVFYFKVILTTPIQCSNESSGQSKQGRKRNKAYK